MDLYIKIKGDESLKIDEIVLEHTSITSVDFKFDSPDNSEVKSGQTTATLKIIGKLNDKAISASKIFATWANLPSSKGGIYRSVEFKAISDQKVFREYLLPDAFIID